MTSEPPPPRDRVASDATAPASGVGGGPEASAATGPPGVPAELERRSLRRAGLYLLAFGSGFAVMALEVAGARLMAPTFGLSAVPWTAIIGVILAALAVGNHLGGRLADRGGVPLAWILAGAGVAAFVPIVGVAVPPLALDAVGFAPGAVLAAALLFAPPVLALGTAVPYLVRADTEGLDEVGRRAGDVGAAATVGSIAGTFLTGFVLLPLLPLPLLLGLTAALLFGLALLARLVLGGGPRPEAGIAGALLAALLGSALTAGGAGLLHREQTLYAAVEVTERDWGGRLVRELWQNGGSSSAEYVDTGEPAHRYAVASERLLEPVVDRVDRALVLGGAALTLPVAFLRRRPDMTVDVVELDAAVTRLAERYFAAGQREYPGLTVHHAAARRFLADADPAARWDLIYVDVFDHLLTVPWTVVTREATEALDARLAPGGLVVINVLSPLAGPGVAFLERFLATLGAVFPVVRAYPVVVGDDPGAVRNVLVVAARDAAHVPPVDLSLADVAPAGPVLTDAWAPVEALQARLFLQGIRWQ